MLPRLDRLALHAEALPPTGAYVPCTPGQATPEAAHAWLREHPDELDLFTMEPLADPIGEDTIAYWDELVFRWQNGQIGGTKMKVPIPEAWSNGGPEALIRVSPVCTAPGQHVEYVRRVSLYLEFVNQYKNYPYGIEVPMPPDATHAQAWTIRRDYPNAFKGRGQSQDFMVPMREADKSNNGEFFEMKGVLNRFLDDCKAKGLFNWSRVMNSRNPFPPGDLVPPNQGSEAWGPMETYTDHQGQTFQWNNAAGEGAPPPGTPAPANNVDVAALIEALRTAEGPGMQRHRLLMLYNVMGDGANQRPPWQRALQFGRNLAGFPTLVKIINDNAEKASTNEISLSLVRDALKTLHRVYGEPVRVAAWHAHQEIEVSTHLLEVGAVQAILKALQGVDFNVQDFDDIQRYCANNLAVLLSSRVLDRAMGTFLEHRGAQTVARAVAMTRGRSLDSLMALLNRLWDYRPESLLTTLAEDNKVLPRLVRLSQLIPDSDMLEMNMQAVRDDASDAGLDQLQPPGDVDFADSVVFVGLVANKAAVLLRMIDEADENDNYFNWGPGGDYYYMRSALYGMRFLKELAYRGTEAQKHRGLNVLIEFAGTRAVLEYFVRLRVIGAMISLLGANAGTTPTIKVKAARVLVRLVEHQEDDGYLDDRELYVNRAVVRQCTYNGHPLLLFSYWARLQNNDQFHPADVREFRDMLRRLAQLSAEFNTKLAIQARSRPSVPDPRNV